VNVTKCFDIFSECVQAIRAGELIEAVSASDKEYHFQNWFQARLDNLGIKYDELGRNTYPDYRLVHLPEGYEVKGLAWPGREKDYDSNSQVPSGLHKGRTIFYAFGRYPKDISEYPENERGKQEYPVIDFVICHGDFLNLHHDYIHKNKSIKGFGSYGDIMIRDRKMYVVPTPFALTEGTTGVQTLILPLGFATDERFERAGELIRKEANELVVGYSFDLETNQIKADKAPNPTAGKEHHFVAYRLIGQGGKPVATLSKVGSE
jgi:hypothetical protein